jgi:hypothetical protein
MAPISASLMGARGLASTLLPYSCQVTEVRAQMLFRFYHAAWKPVPLSPGLDMGIVLAGRRDQTRRACLF